LTVVYGLSVGTAFTGVKAVILRRFTEFDSFGANYVTVIMWSKESTSPESMTYYGDIPRD